MTSRVHLPNHLMISTVTPSSVPPDSEGFSLPVTTFIPGNSSHADGSIGGISCEVDDDIRDDSLSAS